MTMPNGQPDEILTPPPMEPPLRDRGSINLGGGNMRNNIITSLIVSVVVIMLVSFTGGWGLVTKNDFTNNMKDIVEASNTSKEELAKAKSDVDAAIKGVPSVVTSAVNSVIAQTTSQLTTQLGALSAKADTISNTLQNTNTTVTQLSARITTLTNENESLRTQVAELEDRIDEWESGSSSSSSSGGGGSDIPNVDIDVRVTDEGTFYALYGGTANATLSEFKMVLDNKGTKDIEDVVLYVYVYFDNCASATQGIISSSYGSWSMRERQRDEVQLKGRLSRLEAGESRRVYITLLSIGSNDGITYMDVGASDVEIVDWNYE